MPQTIQPNCQFTGYLGVGCAITVSVPDGGFAFVELLRNGRSVGTTQVNSSQVFGPYNFAVNFKVSPGGSPATVSYGEALQSAANQLPGVYTLAALPTADQLTAAGYDITQPLQAYTSDHNQCVLSGGVWISADRF